MVDDEFDEVEAMRPQLVIQIFLYHSIDHIGIIEGIDLHQPNDRLALFEVLFVQTAINIYPQKVESNFFPISKDIGNFIRTRVV